MSTAVINFKTAAPGASEDRGEMQQPAEKQKLGHRRIDEQGEVSYKKVPTNALMSAIQLGIANSIGSLASRPDRDLLLQDFQKIENVAFPAAGSATTPSHSFGDFRFKTYAPIAFRYFRELFNIKPADFLSLGKNIRLLVMNNLLPQNVTMHEKYDLKGSTYKRLASKSERAKASPTLKDLDFIENHPNEGLSMDPISYDSLIRTISRDCLVLESFKIMDYSLLVGIHNMELTSTGDRNRAQPIRQESEDELEQADDLPSTSRGETETRRRDSISVHNPNFYAQRFLSFMTEHVFKKGPALKQSPSRRRARKSVGDEDLPISTRDINPVISVGIPRAVVERLFASSNAKADEREPLQEEEDEFIFHKREPSMTMSSLLLSEIPFIDDPQQPSQELEQQQAQS
ncbi:1-phosphatidylinositol-4-phosphate 5-kinase [Ostertagia ostertagi]